MRLSKDILKAAMTAQAPATYALATLDDSLNQLASLDPQQRRIVELKFFGGLSIEETGRGAAHFSRHCKTRLGQGLALPRPLKTVKNTVMSEKRLVFALLGLVTR